MALCVLRWFISWAAWWGIWWASPSMIRFPLVQAPRFSGCSLQPLFWADSFLTIWGFSKWPVVSQCLFSWISSSAFFPQLSIILAILAERWEARWRPYSSQCQELPKAKTDKGCCFWSFTLWTLYSLLTRVLCGPVLRYTRYNLNNWRKCHV